MLLSAGYNFPCAASLTGCRSSITWRRNVEKKADILPPAIAHKQERQQHSACFLPTRQLSHLFYFLFDVSSTGSRFKGGKMSENCFFFSARKLYSGSVLQLSSIWFPAAAGGSDELSVSCLVSSSLRTEGSVRVFTRRENNVQTETVSDYKINFSLSLTCWIKSLLSLRSLISTFKKLF